MNGVLFSMKWVGIPGSIWLLGFLVGPALADDVVLSPREASWRYLRGLEEASSPDAAAWRQPGFDDAGWPTGTAPFGFGDPPFGTDLSVQDPPMRDNYTCLFLRRTFQVDSLEGLVHYEALVDYDDGFVAWINGQEVLRVNMPGSTGDPLTIEDDAVRGRESGSYDPFIIPEPETFLVEGTNTLAVQAFNVSAGSSDFKFDLELVDPFGPDIQAPEVQLIIPSPGLVVRSLSMIEVTFTEEVTGVDAADLMVGGAETAGVTGAGAGPYLFEFAEQSPGPVEISWVAEHGITDRAVVPNTFQPVAGWSYTVDPEAPPPAVEISEFLARNRTLFTDEDRETSDWVEIHNKGTAPMDLAGWSLTDDRNRAGKWTFPRVVLEPDAYLVVFASGKDRRLPDADLHTNFQLNSDGEYLALFSPELPRRAATEFDEFPPQRANYSYGLTADGTRGYFVEPTPGEPNDSSSVLVDFVDDVRFSLDHGLYEESFQLELSTVTPGASIRYTVDGSAPTDVDGILYTEPLTVSGDARRAAVTIRAVAFRDGFLPSRVTTRSYIFPRQVLTQPDNPEGFPRRWGAAPRVDYEMDPQVVNDPKYTDRILEGLVDLPTLSIVAHVDDIFGARGIYSNPQGEGVAWERPCSVELIHPDGRKGFQVDCGIRIFGGASRRPDRSPKHSLRLLFKGEYGPTKLRYPLFEGSRVERFDTLALRANYNNSWIHWDSGQRRRGMLLRDQWAKDTQLDMGQPGAYAFYSNLYLNGLYWGVYIVVERPSAPFAADHLGGEKEEYDALNSGAAVDGSTAAWAQLLGRARQDVRVVTNYLAVQEYLDTPNFIDYMLMNFYGGNDDWPSHNWYAARRRTEEGRWRFFSWDAERILESSGSNRLGVSDGNSPGELHTRLRASEEYRLTFGDRAHRHLFDGGALTPEAAAARFVERADEVEKAVAAESARWGDYRRDVHQSQNGPYEFYRYDTHWLPEKDRLLRAFFPQRTRVLLSQLVAASLYPRVPAPTFSQNGGDIEPGFTLTLSVDGDGEEVIYYTLDGTDPRVFGTGEVAGTAVIYGGPVPISDYTVVKARTLSGTDWSALAEATFRFPPRFEHLHVSEIMYNPPEGSGLEFVELFNSGETTLDLAGVSSTNGIDFLFPAGSALGPGGFLVLVSDSVQFAAVYPDVKIGGVYRDNLSNGGEKLTLRGPEGSTIVSVDYEDGDFWPLAPDGLGYSLVLLDPTLDPDDPFAWKASAEPGGSPGEADPVAPVEPVLVSEVVTGTGMDNAIELFNPTDGEISVAGWYLSDSRQDEQSLRKFRIPADSKIPAGGYLVLSQQLFGSPPDGDPGFVLTSRSGQVVLSAARGDGSLTGYVTGCEFGPAVGSGSFGIHGTSLGPDFTALGEASPGADNDSPRVGPIVIHEVHYHPPAGGVEFIELRNLSDGAVALHETDSQRGWQVRGVQDIREQSDYEFPPGSELAPRAYLLLVAGDPGIFRARYGVPGDVVVLGPFGGALDNAGEQLLLMRPVAFGSEVEYLQVDRVRFNDRAPWPEEADGNGPSLERVIAGDYGNEPLNWAASLRDGGTPGAPNSVGVEPPESGLQIPGDVNQDGRINLTDSLVLVSHLAGGSTLLLPCGGDGIEEGGNLALADADGNAAVNLTDVVYLLEHMFLGGPPHVLGSECVVIDGCPTVCSTP